MAYTHQSDPGRMPALHLPSSEVEAMNLAASRRLDTRKSTRDLQLFEEAVLRTPLRAPPTVELTPFANKVGGHTAIFRFSKRAVCKALAHRENRWYEAVEESRGRGLLAFAPRYLGVLNVRLPEDREGERLNPNTPVLVKSLPLMLELAPEVSWDDNRHLVPSSWGGSLPEIPPAGTPTGRTDDAMVADNNRFRELVLLEAFLMQEVPSEASSEIFTMDEEVEEEVRGVDEAPVDLPPAHTPSLHSHRFSQFILLEDLTVDMKLLCALDLKMGTRQYGTGANDSKVQLQRRKCKSTTLRGLGVRVCGMKCYNDHNHEWVRRDKYFGRGLKAGSEFARAFLRFLYNGTEVVSVVRRLVVLLREVAALREVVSALHGFRMYGSLLLLMYDAAAAQPELKVKIIDFAQCALPGDLGRVSPAHPEEIDRGYVKGLESIMAYARVGFRHYVGTEYDSEEAEAAVEAAVRAGRLAGPDPWLDLFDAGETVGWGETAAWEMGCDDDLCSE